jgi:hypothetical protein
MVDERIVYHRVDPEGLRWLQMLRPVNRRHCPIEHFGGIDCKTAEGLQDPNRYPAFKNTAIQGFTVSRELDCPPTDS